MCGEKIEDILYHFTNLIETFKVKPGVAPPVALKFSYNIILIYYNCVNSIILYPVSSGYSTLLTKYCKRVIIM